jgi:hypothetical protein
MVETQCKRRNANQRSKDQRKVAELSAVSAGMLNSTERLGRKIEKPIKWCAKIMKF